MNLTEVTDLVSNCVTGIGIIFEKLIKIRNEGNRRKMLTQFESRITNLILLL